MKLFIDEVFVSKTSFELIDSLRSGPVLCNVQNDKCKTMISVTVNSLYHLTPDKVCQSEKKSYYKTSNLWQQIN